MTATLDLVRSGMREGAVTVEEKRLVALNVGRVLARQERKREAGQMSEKTISLTLSATVVLYLAWWGICEFSAARTTWPYLAVILAWLWRLLWQLSRAEDLRDAFWEEVTNG